METIFNNAKSIKKKGYFLLTFEIFKLAIVNLMTNLIGAKESIICLLLHIINILLLLSMIFCYNKISSFGVKTVKFFIFFTYFLIIVAIVYEGYVFLTNE